MDELLTSDQRNKLVMDNSKLVTYVIRKYYKPYLSQFEDLYHEGLLAMIKATKSYNPEIAEYSTYVIPHIRFAILSYLNINDSQVTLPRDMYSNMRKVSSKISEGLSDDQIMEELGLSKSQYIEITNYLLGRVQLDKEIDGEDNKLSISDTIPDKSINYITDIEYEELESRAIDYVVSQLKNETHAQIYLEYYYSKLYGDKISQDYLHNKYKLSQSYISRVITKGNQILRYYINNCYSDSGSSNNT